MLSYNKGRKRGKERDQRNATADERVRVFLRKKLDCPEVGKNGGREYHEPADKN